MAFPVLAVAGIALSAAQMASSFASGQASASAQRKQLALQKKQWELDVSKAYQDSLSTLGQLKTTYRQSGLEVAQTQANIESLDYWLADENYNDYYASEIAPLQENITSIQNWLGNYQSYYDTRMAQTQLGVDQQRMALGSMFFNNIGTLRQMQEGLAQQQILTAARGQSGSTARLLSDMARQDIINFAGEDMTLDAEGGEYGRRYTNQQNALSVALLEQEQTRYGLQEERRQTQSSLDQALLALRNREKDLAMERQNKENEREIQQLALQDYQAAQQDYLASISETLGSAIELGYLSGQNYDQLAAKVDEYRQFIDADDTEYEELKKNLLKAYEPLEYKDMTSGSRTKRQTISEWQHLKR